MSTSIPLIQEVSFTMFSTIIANHASMFKGLFVCRTPSSLEFLALDNSEYKGLCSWCNNKAEASDWLLYPDLREYSHANTTTAPPEKKLTPKEFLNQYRDALHDERHIRMQIGDLKESAASVGSRVSGPPVQGGSGSSGRLTLMDDALDMEMNELQQALRFSREMKRLVRSTIKAVDDSRYRELLMHRYVGLKSWSYIANRMRYGTTYVRQDLHGRALQAINFEQKNF